MSAVTVLRNSFLQKTPAVGFWLTFPSAPLAKTILASGGLNWVCIDAEHGLITDHHYYELSNAVASSGATPLIRVPWCEEWMIKRALDAGAHGIITPMCHNASDAAKIVSYCKYPPTGTRGYGPMFSPHSFGPKMDGPTYDNMADKELLVVVQIESKEGVKNVEEIAKVPGLDCLFIGPFDLSKQLNVKFGGEEHEGAIQKTLKAAKAAGKAAAIFCTSGEQAKMRLDQGFDMVSIVTDIAALSNGINAELADMGGAKAQKRSGY